MMSLYSRALCVIIGIIIFGVISFLVRRRRIYNFYAVTWFISALTFIILGAWPQFIEILTSLMGINLTPLAILALGIGGLMFIALHLSIIVTDQHRQIRNFEKEIALLKHNFLQK